jgi:hypothetical protein
MREISQSTMAMATAMARTAIQNCRRFHQAR